MPFSNFQRAGVYAPSGNPDTTHYTPPYAPGEIGVSFDASNGHSYQVVIIDPALNVASATGPILANQPLCWKDKTKHIVTNVPRTGDPAGIARVNAAPGEVIHVLQWGLNIPVASNGSGAAGDKAVIAPTGNLAVVANVAAATYAPHPYGIIRGAAVGGVINVDVNIEPIN